MINPHFNDTVLCGTFCSLLVLWFFFFFFSTGFRRFAFYALHLAIIQAHRVLGLTASYGYIAWEVLCLTGLFNGYIII